VVVRLPEAKRHAGVDHEHADCGHGEMVWLPPSSAEVEQRPLVRKSFCLRCGLVRNVGSDRARPIGYWVQVVIRVRAALEREHRRSPHAIAKLPSAQVRLILRDILQTPGFDDPYAMTKSAQVDLVLRAIHRIRPDVPRAIVEDALEEPERPAQRKGGRARGVPTPGAR
jgi:hypothetical protein